jgi:hypothetical protein
VRALACAFARRAAVSCAAVGPLGAVVAGGL